MIKLFGICVLFLSARIIYETYISKNETELKKMEDILLFANLLYVNVMELKMPLSLGISSLKFKISPFLDRYIESFLNLTEKKQYLSVRECFVSSFMKLSVDKKIRNEMKNLLGVLGNADKNTVSNYKNIATKNIEKYIKEYKEKMENKGKTAGAITFGTSTILLILLI